tara:strand:+ start:2170 stop:2391 length:222 start_codon:yes stop_codon:yes gene_type:complete
MAIKNKSEMSSEIEIDLTGPDGNAFALMGYAKNFSRQLGIDSKPIIKDMMSGDYEHLLEVFEENFGSFVTLYR